MCVIALLKRDIALAQELVPLAKSDISLTKQFVRRLCSSASNGHRRTALRGKRNLPPRAPLPSIQKWTPAGCAVPRHHTALFCPFVRENLLLKPHGVTQAIKARPGRSPRC